MIGKRGFVAGLAVGVALCVGCGSTAAQAPTTVWVNTRSGVYHCAGTRDYGKTAQGRYLAEVEARQRGYRANGGRACGPLPPDTGRVGRAAIPRPTHPDSAPGAPAGATSSCVLSRVTDGDTIECEGGERVRLIGVDAPEGDQQPFGTASAAALAALLPARATLVLEADTEPRDPFGRVLAYVWLDGQPINWLLVRRGWAVSIRYAPNVRYAELFESAEARARAESRGLWNVNGFQCRPVDHRRRAC